MNPLAKVSLVLPDKSFNQNHSLKYSEYQSVVPYKNCA